MTTVEITKDTGHELPTFSGALDSSVYAQNGDVMRLLVFYSDKVENNKREKIKVKILELDRYFNKNGEIVDEGSADDIIAEFTGFLENKNDKFFFSEMQPVNNIVWEQTPPFPWFMVTFAGENDSVKNEADNETSAETFFVVIGKSDEPPDSPVFEIGFIIEKEDGTFIGSSGSRINYFYGEYLYENVFKLFDIRTKLDSVNLLNITKDQMTYGLAEDFSHDKLVKSTVINTTSIYESTASALNEKEMKAINAALKKIDHLIKTSKNPYFQNIQEVNKYYETLDSYKGQVEQYQEMTKSDNYTQNDCTNFKDGVIYPMFQELNKLESNVHSYLKNSSKPPKAYVDRINKNIAIITRNDEISKLLDNPIIRIMGLLPGAGVVTGSLKLIQGKYFDGLFEIFGAITTYGSFLKLSRVARAFRKSSSSTVEMLYSYRYRNLVSSITNAKIMDKVTETSLRQSGTFLGNLFSTVGSFKSLKGHVDSISILHRNKEYIVDMTRKAISGVKAGMITDVYTYMGFLDDLKKANATAEFFAHIRVLHTAAKGGKSAYATIFEAIDDMEKLLGFQQLPGVQEFDMEIVENTRILFTMFDDMKLEIDKVIESQTARFTNTTSIINHFNQPLNEYDMFGLNRNADVRYKNTRIEMLLALDEIYELWSVEEKDRDNWIEANRSQYSNKAELYLQKQWAIRNKSTLSVGLPESLETCISNFIEKLKGQIEQIEALTGKGELMFLEGQVHLQGDCLYDLNAGFFREHGSILVKKYY